MIREFDRQQWFKRWKAHTSHPNLIFDYFEDINTKEKAYWLGFLYGDGHICEHCGSILIQLKLSRRDESVIDKFCECLGIEKNTKKHGIDKRTGAEFAYIRFSCIKIGIDLLNHGVLFRKAGRIEFPQLANRELELAFLLGYYDADGKQNTTKITSSNARFLEQIKDKFNTSKICVESMKLCGEKIEETYYSMCLGAGLFIEMMRNYEYSMPRKRWFPCTQEEKARRGREALTSEKRRIWKEQHIRWELITLSELRTLAQEASLRQIAARYNVDHKTVAKKCDKLGIPRPERSYWQERRALRKESKEQ